MKSLKDSITDFLAETNDQTTAKRNTQASIPLVQVLTPPLLWNWATPPIGQATLDQLDFCDAMPQSVNGKIFAASSKSFSVGYSSFLNLVNAPSFPLPQALNQTLSNNQLPASYAKGWVQSLNRAGQLEWKRLWNVSDNPETWLKSFKQGQQKKSAAWEFNDPQLSISTKESTTLPLDDTTTVTLSAEAVGRIAVNPDVWYDSSVVTLAQYNKYYLTVPPDILFGNAGLMNCRIAEFIVALKPGPSIIIDKSLMNQGNTITINTAGFSFTNGNSRENDDKSIVRQVNFSLAEVGQDEVQISGTIKGADSDNLFIVAVVLESFQMNTNNQLTL